MVYLVTILDEFIVSLLSFIFFKMYSTVATCCYGLICEYKRAYLLLYLSSLTHRLHITLPRLCAGRILEA